MLQTSVSACVYVFNANYCASMLTPTNRASLGEPLQTLSELVFCEVGDSMSTLGTSKWTAIVTSILAIMGASPRLVSRLPARLRFQCGYIFVCFLYLGQQFGQSSRHMARSCNSFRDVQDDRRKIRIPFSRQSRRIFKHVDISFFGTPCHFDHLPIQVLAKLIPFEPFDNHQKHSSRTRKTQGHSGHLLKGRKLQGSRVLLRQVRHYILEYIHLSLF